MKEWSDQGLNSMFRKITLLYNSAVTEKSSMICVFTVQHSRGHLIFRVEKRKQNESLMWTKGAYLAYSPTASPRSCSHLTRVAMQFSQDRDIQVAPCSCRHRRTAPGHGLFPSNSLHFMRGPSYRFLLRIGGDEWECPLSHSMTPDQPCLIAKPQKAA